MKKIFKINPSQELKQTRTCAVLVNEKAKLDIRQSEVRQNPRKLFREISAQGFIFKEIISVKHIFTNKLIPGVFQDSPDDRKLY